MVGRRWSVSLLALENRLNFHIPHVAKYRVMVDHQIITSEHWADTTVSIFRLFRVELINIMADKQCFFIRLCWNVLQASTVISSSFDCLDTDNKVMVLLSCPMRSELVTSAQKIASLNAHIIAEVYDLSYFPDLHRQYKIMSLPCLVVNNRDIPFGQKNVAQLVDLLTKAQ